MEYTSRRRKGKREITTLNLGPSYPGRADREVYLVDGVRTAQGRYGGALAEVRPDDLAGLVVREVVRRAGLAQLLSRPIPLSMS